MSKKPKLKSKTTGSLHPAGSAWVKAEEYYWRTNAWWFGRRVRLLRDIKTHGGKLFRKGRIARVERKFGGLTLRGRKGLHVTRVNYRSLEVDMTPNTD